MTSLVVAQMIYAQTIPEAEARLSRKEMRQPREISSDRYKMGKIRVSSELVGVPFRDLVIPIGNRPAAVLLLASGARVLPREMREAIAANARTKLYFQLSTQDAQTLARELEPELGAHDLANLPRHTAAVRLCHNGETGRPFTLHTDPLPTPDPARADAVRQASRARIGVAREDMEDRLAQRGRSSRQGLAA
jgi:hypothetical protein